MIYQPVQDFTDFIQRKFPNDPRLDFYKKPNFPATKLGKVLSGYTKISSPADVVAFHQYGGMFGSDSIVLTKTHCFYEKGNFSLEDVKSATQQDSKVNVFVNQGGTPIPHTLKTKNEQAAKLLTDFFDDISYLPKTEAIMQPVLQLSEGLNKDSIQWVELKEEVLRTIDQLNQLFQDGKITLTEYESTKLDLLSRI
jgi:hypothetical protein